MKTTPTRIDNFIISEAKKHGFRSVNEYVTYLYEYEQTRKKKDVDQILKSHNGVMTFLELERLELKNLNKELVRLLDRLEEVGLDLRLNSTERAFLGNLMEVNERNGKWVYKNDKH